ncbi:TPA: signal recognition particle-docking protein FtsY [Neisseria subflava]|jgi:signal recognition particle-docking protein ftsY|uniref:signal recognition particle-docking protein FtsY n=1 Tax=unclassified Neisseria TaxID=2623750 RepID=UPI0008C03C52|nr:MULTISPECIES: signal recognition particle-docking protein FtsY [unclassified Neisseria]OFK87222.1 signal recognition particle-docking protein FtsY [Neisseria sp. HMSC061E12]OFP76723.1 signal recognition particle-docking protein FtsY [Neisseria sp. HMSC066B07]OHO83470.1 signal recognition particle-docking protein FtsY [Neisseria sp. HMSC056A04]OHQ26159.1 signal recognition particle-docking protein FtsY [Neisseria sp. HMSC066F04]OHR16314.1 signal recognition particle-docking protein FtsY [Nei
MFSFFRRKKKQETPAPEEAQVQETAAKVESEVAQVFENIKEDAESLAENVKGHVESVVESAVETVSETVEQVREALTETPSETVEKVEEHLEAAKEAAVKTVSEAVEQVQETVAEMPSEAAEVAEEVAEQAEAVKEAAVETVSEAVEQVQETVSEMPSEVAEAAEKAAEQAEAVKEEAVEAVSEAVEQVQEAVVETPVEAPAPAEEHKLSWAARLKQGLTKSRDKMAKSLAGVFGGGQIDEDLYEELETVLITSDMGMEATEYLMKDVRDRVSLKGLKDGNELRGALKDALYDLIKPLEKPLVLPETKEPFVIMLAGINGAGKTTSIGKLAKYFQAQGKSVLLAAGDTFRAAAREQLQAWGERNNVTVISQTTGDSAAVCFDAVQAAKARGIDIVLADTAGRLPTQLHLMEEIKKVKRVLQKAMPDAPHEIIVVLDANIGQNAVNQVKAFDEALGLTGLIVTKLDGTAKGGILAALASDRPVPVRYIGVGEGIDDLRPFNAKAFVDALLD